MVCVWGIVLFPIKLSLESFEIIFSFDILCLLDLEFSIPTTEDAGLNDPANDLGGPVEDMEAREGMFGTGGVPPEFVLGELREMEIERGLTVLPLLLMLGSAPLMDGVDDFFGGCLGGMSGV